MYRRIHCLLAALLTRSSASMPLAVPERTLCKGGQCDKLDMKYERIVPVQPGIQWPDNGGYCGSWASQRAILGIGAWVSQQQVRDHTVSCGHGAHDEEILSCNIVEAWSNLKIDFNAFDYNHTATPQIAAYQTWLKKQLVSGYAVTWAIMWDGQTYPVYGLTPPSGMYGHYEPVIGIQSNHPLDDPKVYDDDVVLHFTDGGNSTVHRLFSTLAGTWAGPGHPAKCGDGVHTKRYQYCIGNPYGFGWAAKGFTHDIKAAESAPASLAINPWMSEPDTRSGKKPEALAGTLTATELVVGTAYEIYRWDTVLDAFTYDAKYKKSSFTATKATHVYADETSFPSNGTTYYRVVKA